MTHREDPLLFTRAEVRATGLSDRQVDVRLKSGALVAARRGVLQWASEGPVSGGARVAPSVPTEIRAALLANPGRDLVVSHATAARLMGLPRPLAGWPQPQFTATSGPSRRRSGTQIKVAALAAQDVVRHHGVDLTSPARTLADCLRTMPGRDALATVDAALHQGLVGLDAVLAALRGQARWPGVALARQVLALAEPLRESPLESWSAWAFSHTGVVAPAWQVDVREPDGPLIGRADCWWEPGVIGEAGGRSKYALGAAERGGGSEAVFTVLQRERHREQRLRDAGADVVRWSAGDVLHQPSARQLAQRINGAIAVAQKAVRFTGVVAPTMHQLPTGQAP